ncbi:MAG TPA: hypothetical protein PKD72_02540, partial [Gemmatales bacterium]|nr:hypothetical protein [Gemmatales bacterium]
MLVSKFTKCISSLLIACYVSITALYADTVPVIVFSDSFTNLTPGHNPAVSPWSTVNYNNFSNWTVTRGSVDVVNLAGDAKPMWFQNYAGPIPSFNFIDLDGTTRQSGEITTKNPLNLAPGNYRLSFDLAGNLGRLPNSEGVMVRLDGLGITQTYELGSEEGFTTKTIDFTVSTPTTTNISFSNDSDDPTTMNDNQGPG